MPTFGAYETVQEVSRGAFGSVWSARSTAGAGGGGAAGAPPRFAVKTCKPDLDLAGEDQARAAVTLFVEQAEIQKRLSQLNDSRWAPVHEIGTMAPEQEEPGREVAGAYYVTDYYPRASVERIIASRLRVDSASLHSVVAAVVTGIKQIRDFLKRPHGNLRPSNILLAGEGGLDQLRVVLTDPAPGSRIGGRTDVGADMRAVGELIYQLVTHQAYHERGGWPISDTPDWKRLAGGEKWRGLCNRLLDPNPASTPTVEEVEQTLLNLGASKGGGRGKLIGIGVAAVVVLAGAAVGIKLMMGSGGGANGKGTADTTTTDTPVTGDTSEWRDLCTEYASWFRTFSDDLFKAPGGQGEQRIKVYAERIPELADLLKSLKVNDGPAKIAADRSPLEDLRDKPTSAALSKEGRKETTELLKVVRGVKGVLAAGHWSVLDQVQGAEEAWKSRGWESAAAFVAAAKDGIKPEGGVARNIDALLAMADQVKLVNEAWAAADVHAKRIAKGTEQTGGDAVLASFAGWSTAYPAQALAGSTEKSKPLETLRQSIQTVRDAGEKVAKFLDDPLSARVCFKVLADGEKDFYAKVKSPQSITPEVYADWTNLAKKDRYTIPDASADPRNGRDLAGAMKKVEDEWDKLQKNNLKPGAASGAALTSLLESLHVPGATGDDDAARIRSARKAIDDLKSLRWDCEHRGAIEGVKYDEAMRNLAIVSSEWRGLNSAKDFDRQTELARLNGLDSPVPDSPSIRTWWQGAKTVFKIATEDREIDRVREVEKRLEELSTAVSRWSMKKAPGQREEAWQRDLGKAVADKRERMIGEFLKSRTAESTWTDDDVKKLNESYQSWTAQVDAVAGAYAQAEALMNMGYGLEETPTDAESAGRKSVGQLVAGANGPVFDEIKGTMGAVTQRVAKLASIDASMDAAKLVTTVKEEAANHPEATIAAWRRLALVGGGSWPATIQQLRDETGMRDALRFVTNDARLGGRKQALADEFKRERMRRWESFVKRAATVADVDEAIDPGRAVRDLEIDVTSATDPVVKYRLAAARLRAVVETAGATDEQINGAIAAFAKKVPGEIKSRLKAAATVDALMKLAEGKDEGPPKVDPKTLGPAQAGWAAAESKDAAGNDVLTFTKGSQSLAFVRVEPQGGEAFYMGSTEVSLGMFLDIAGTGRPWEQMKKLLSGLGPDDAAPRGPRAWAPRNRGASIEAAREWLQETRPAIGSGPGQVPAYAAEFLDPQIRDGKTIRAEMAPSNASPMQYVSPAAAEFVAATVGCRLPTQAEWASAYRVAESRGNTRTNLRDLAWRAQWKHLTDTMAANPKSPQDQMIFPDQDAFVPADKAATPTGRLATVAPDAGMDNFVWFDRVAPESTGIQYLRGNVAEYILNNPGEGLKPGGTAEEARAYVRQHAADLFVIGGSAMSAPELAWNQPLAVRDARGAEGGADTAEGWPDVGFRLAFSAAGTAPAKKTQAQLAQEVLRQKDADLYGLAP